MMHAEYSHGARVRWAACLVALAGLVVYANSLTGPFILDDTPAIVDNATIRTLWPIGSALSPPAGTAGVEGRPILNLTFAVNYALGGLDVRGYHATNVLIHVLAGLLLFGWLRRTFGLASMPAPIRRRDVGVALSIALLWTVHPLQTESVTYIVQRAESLGGLLSLLCLYGLVRGAESQLVGSSAGAPLAETCCGKEVRASAAPTGRSGCWFAAAITACAVGMGTKETVLVAPLLALAYDRIFLVGSWRELVRKRAWLYAGLAVCVGLLVALKFTQHGAYIDGRPETLPAPPSLDMLTSPAVLLDSFRSRLWADVTVTPWTYLMTQPGVMAHYVRLAIWPDALCLYYNWPFAAGLTDAWPGVAALAVAVVLMGWALVRHPRLGFPGLWFFLTLAPSSSILPTDDAAFEHRMYLPLAAILTVVVIAVLMLTERWGETRPRGVGRVRVGLVVLAAVALGLQTMARNHDYRSTLAIWEAALRVRPDNPMAYHNRGAEYARLGQYDLALADLTALVAMQPENAEAHASLADALARTGRNAEAFEHFALAVKWRPSNANARVGLANLLLMQGDSAAALEHLQIAVQWRPDLAEVQSNLGIALCSLGRVRDGLPHLEEAVRLKPGSAESRNNLGRALMLLGRLPEAESQLAEAVRLRLDYAEAQGNLEAVRERRQ
ncbi:MAG: tetratricopeptide repeat protein [Lentisphaerae bacterium]|nr:tetratricopeptide repeat protein [Lentisphaerota bacterium]